MLDEVYAKSGVSRGVVQMTLLPLMRAMVAVHGPFTSRDLVGVKSLLLTRGQMHKTQLDQVHTFIASYPDAYRAFAMEFVSCWMDLIPTPSPDVETAATDETLSPAPPVAGEDEAPRLVALQPED